MKNKDDFKSLEIKRLELENNSLRDRNKTLKIKLTDSIKEKDILNSDIEKLKGKVEMWHSHFLELRATLKKVKQDKKLNSSLRFACEMLVIFVFLVLFNYAVM